MRKTVLFVLILFLMISGFISSPLSALDVGLYGTVSGASGTIEAYTDVDESDEEDQSSSGYGVGIILNGHFGDNFMINRLMFMAEYRCVEVDAWGYDAEYYIDSMSLYDTMGFVIYSTQTTDIWLGPQLGFLINTASDESDNDYDEGIGISLGVALGADFPVTEKVILGVEAGFRMIYSYVENGDEGYGADILSAEGCAGLSLMLRF